MRFEKRFIYGALLLVCCLGLSCEHSSTSIDSKPNVIIVITDDQGYGDLACHGNPIIQTPNMDQLYGESVRFTNFHVSPTCSPTRAALMTGRYNNRTGVWHTIAGWSLLRKNEQTIGNLFQEADYATGAFGKWHLGDNYPFRALDRGFQEAVLHGGGGVTQTPDYWGNDYFDDTYFKNGVPTQYQGYCTDVFFDEAIDFIERNQDQPFFCYLATNAPHGPFNVKETDYARYSKLPDSLLNQTQKRFYGMITNIDENLGRLRQKLEDLQIADNTILIFMTDNGTAAGIQKNNDLLRGYNAGMRGTKGSEYEGGHRVPLFVHWKDGGLNQGKDIKELAAHIDIYPTLAELCGLQLSSQTLPLDGMSLASLIQNSNENWPNRYLITDSQRLQKPQKWRKSAVMHNTWRLINGTELYNLEVDPSQVNDIAQAHPDMVQMMRGQYEKWWNSMSSTFEQEPEIIIGSPKANPLVITCHDWHSPDNQAPWNQYQIRNGKQGNGYWRIQIVEAGTYEFRLSRYPFEANLALNATTPGYGPSEEPGMDRSIPDGKALKILRATLKIGDLDKLVAEVDANQNYVTLQATLPAGTSQLEAAFIDESANEFGPYYIGIKKL